MPHEKIKWWDQETFKWQNIDNPQHLEQEKLEHLFMSSSFYLKEMVMFFSYLKKKS